MKYYMPVLVLLGLAAAIARVTASNNFDEEFLRVIEKCIEGDAQSVQLASPSLTLLKIPYMKLNYDGYTMSLHEVNIRGLKNLSVQIRSLSPYHLTVSLEFFIPTIAVRADRYHLQGMAMWFLKIDDKGIFKSNIYNLKGYADVQFGIEGLDTAITGLNLDYSFDGIQVHLNGSNNLVISGVKNKIWDLLNDREMKEQLQNLIINRSRKCLQEYTPDKLRDKISELYFRQILYTLRTKRKYSQRN